MIEVEAVINSRPLSYVTADDLDQPLTPVHLLTGQRLLSLPDAVGYQDIEEDFNITSNHFTRRLTYLNRVLDEFWKRWRKEYLSELRDSHSYRGKTSDAITVGVGDIVLVYDDSKPRGCWKLARVEELIVGRDGLTRGAVLRVASTSGRRAVIRRRPLQRLYPLEINCLNHDEDMKTDRPDAAAEGDGIASEENTNQECQSEVPVRPRRAADTRAKDWFRALATCIQQDNSD